MHSIQSLATSFLRLHSFPSSCSTAAAPTGWPVARLTLSILLPVLVVLQAMLVPTPARAQQHDYEVSPEEMTRQAAGHFPIRRCALGVVCVTLSEPRVGLPAGDERIHLSTRVRPELGSQVFDTGEVEIAGKPRYEPDRGAFFLDGARVVDSRFPGLGQSQARTVSELASGLLAESLRKEPIYVLDDADARQALARLVLREVRVRDGKLLLVVGDDEP